MKRMLALALCLAVSTIAVAERKLEVIDPSEGSEPTAEDLERGKRYLEAQKAASEIKPAVAKDFVRRLSATVDRGLKMSAAGQMDGKKARDQSAALNKLNEEGQRFAGFMAPFASCAGAAAYARLAWSELLTDNVDKAQSAHSTYIQEAEKCKEAAGA